MGPGDVRTPVLSCPACPLLPLAAIGSFIACRCTTAMWLILKHAFIPRHRMVVLQIEQAHMADEWVHTSQLQKMKGILEQWFELA